MQISQGEVTSPEEFNIRMRLMETRDVAVAVVGRMTDEERKAFLLPFLSDNSPQPEMNIVDRLLSRRIVLPGRTVYIMEVGIEHPNPQLAAKVADYFAEEFINYNNRLTVMKATKAVAELQTQAKIEGDRVEKLQADMNALVDNNNSDFSKVRGQYDNLAAEKDTADAMHRQILTTIEQQRSKIILMSPSYQIVDSAKNHVVQSEPKTVLLLISGFFLGLMAALIALITAFLLSHFRHRPPPAKLAS